MDDHKHKLTATTSTVVGQDLAEVLPKHSKSWIRQPHLISLNLRVMLVILSATALGFDASMMNGLQSLSTWRDYFGNPSASLLGTINAMLSLGVILGAIPAGWASDKFGRRHTIAFGDVILISAAIMQAASHNIATFILSRFFVGFGIEFTSVPAPVLITEIAYPTHRGKLTSLYQTCFYLGAIASSWTTFGTFHIANSTWSWRIPSALQAGFPLIQLVFFLAIPESPRWLIGQGKIIKARDFIRKFHAAGDDSAPLVDFEMREMMVHIQKEKEQAGMGLTALVKTKADKKRLAVALFVPVISQWSGSGVITYYLALVLNSIGITDSFHQTLINGIFQIFNFCAAVLGAFLVDRVGRRRLFIFSISGMLIFFTILTACSAAFARSHKDSLGLAVLVFLFVYFFHYDVAVSPLTFAYPVEIMPFHTRQKTMSLVYGLNELLHLFNSFVNPIALEAIAWKYYIVYIVLIAVMLVVVFLFFPETRGYSLEEIASIFEGPALVRRQKRAVGLSEPDEEKVSEQVEVVEHASKH